MVRYSDNNQIISYLKAHPEADLSFCDCGLLPYTQALALQTELRDLRIEGLIPDTILLLEHPPVLTLGIRKDKNRLLVDEETLTDRGVEIVQINRGGGVTAHNPGQLVVYPIVRITERRIRVVPYIRFLESICIEIAQSFKLEAHRRNRLPGVWIGEEKLASVGVQIVKGVTMHGIAMNISNDLSLFDSIIPCGLEGVTMTSMETASGYRQTMGSCKDQAVDICRRFFAENPVHRRRE